MQTISATPLTTSETTAIIAGLNRMARNIWWTWDQEAQELFAELSPRSWQNLYHNAVAVLREVSDYELRVRLQDGDFAARVRLVLHDFRGLPERPADLGPPKRPRPAQAIRSPISPPNSAFTKPCPSPPAAWASWPGDHAKSASDLGLGFAGISLFYREGYFQQTINQDNWQTEYYTLLHPREPAAGTGARRQGRAAGLRRWTST